MLKDKYVELDYTGGNEGEDLKNLRKKYPGRYFKIGKYKGHDALFALADVVTKTYSEPIESAIYENTLYFPPETLPALEALERDKEYDDYKVKKKLANGTTIKIIPAQAEPKRVFFGKKKKDDDEQNPFKNSTSDYGKLAYKIYRGIRENRSPEEEEKISLIEAAILRSYDMNIDLMNIMIELSDYDIEAVMWAAMGVGDEAFEKKAMTE